MASPVVQSASEASSSSATPTITEPASAAQDDLLIAVVGSADAGTAITGLTGWTQLGEGDDGVGNRFWYGWIIRGASAPDLVAAAANANWVAMCVRIDGHDPTTPIGTDHATATGTSVNPDAPNVDPGSSRDHLAVLGVVQEGKNDNRFTDSLPTNYTEQADIGTGGGGAGTGHVGGAMNSRAYTGQAENPGTHTSSRNDGWWVTTIIVRPDAAAAQTVTGSLLSRSPTFPTGVVTPGNVTVTGILLSRSPDFPIGAANATNTIDGVLLSRSPSFPTGTVTPGNVTLDGVLLSRSPTFPIGSASFPPQTVTGILLSRSPSFPTGAVNATNTIDGSLLSRSPTFPTGVVTPGNVTLTGVLLSRSPTFPIGIVFEPAGSPQTVTGSLLSRSPSFPTGALNATNTLSGVLLSRSPTFPTGTVTPGNVTLSGAALFLDLPGSTGHRATTPDVPAFNLVDTFFVGAFATFADWSTTRQNVYTHWEQVGNKRSWILRLTALGALQVRASDDGITNEGVASPNLGNADGSSHWFGFDFNAGFIRFYKGGTDRDNPVWVELSGSSSLPTVTTVNDTDVPMEVGANNGGIGDPVSGKIHKTVLYSDLSRSTLEAAFDANDFSPGDSDTDTAVDSTGKTWTINGVNSVIGGSPLTRSPTFPIGSVLSEITVPGILLARSPTFPAGALSSTITVSGVLLARSPTFPTGTVSPGNVTLLGVLLARSPTFPTGALLVAGAFFWEKDLVGFSKTPVSFTKRNPGDP